MSVRRVLPCALLPRRWSAIVGVLLVVLGTASCGGDKSSASDSPEPPRTGMCRLLVPEDITTPTNSDPAVDCAGPHTAETFLVGTFAGDENTGHLDDKALGAYVFPVCQKAFMGFLGGDESLVMRSTLTWAWFRPTEKGWQNGARWFRCDVIGGGEQSKDFVPLPTTAKGLLLGRPDDRWLVCATGPTVVGAVKVPCSDKHDWRAISTVQVGKPTDDYPGDRVVEVTTREYCSDQVGAWLNYPVTDYDFGYTWFHEGEWKAGNRRSICWARTDQ